jgi:predicted SAM-dependent methyltransferase
VKLHIGSGPLAIPGWTNVDVVALPGVDVVLDAREAWPFTGVALIFAEHFLEHLTLREGLEFLRQCRRVLAPDGVLRLSTPNLDWVWLTHYRPPHELSLEEQLIGCLEINRAFHGWGHQFLYNHRSLELALRAAGFASVEPQHYGESTREPLRNLERHERHQDVEGAPSVIVVEASGMAAPDDAFEARIAEYVRDFEAR